jgi:hypothetical protein
VEGKAMKKLAMQLPFKLRPAWVVAGVILIGGAIVLTTRFTNSENPPPMPSVRDDKHAEARRKRAELDARRSSATDKLPSTVNAPPPPMPPRVTPDELVAADVNGTYTLGLWSVELRVSNGRRVAVSAKRNGKRAAPRLRPPTHIGVPGGETIVLECDGERLDIYIGTEKDDLIYADTAQHCMIFALGGNDTVRGTDGEDYINTGTGRDILRPSKGDDKHIDLGEEDWIETPQGIMPAAEARVFLAAKPKD